MTRYKVVIEDLAHKDLLGILHYISETLKRPSTAKKIYASIKEQILTLDRMPLRHSLVQFQPYTSLGVRKLLVGGYITFYVVDEVKFEVHILRIIYNRREWRDIL